MEPYKLSVMLLTAMVLGISAGIVAAVYRCVLAYEPVLNWWFKFGARFEGRKWYPPIWGCLTCISGQMGLWFYLLLSHWTLSIGFVISMLISICSAIIVGRLFGKFLDKL